MKTFGMALVVMATAVSTAAADPVLYNATAKKLNIEITLPSGKKDTGDVSGHTPGIDSESFVLAAGVNSVKVALLDDMNETVWTGTSGRDDSWLIIEDAKGKIAVLNAGVRGGTPLTTALILINTSGDDLTIDLEGHNGVGAKRGIKPSVGSFDTKKPIRLEDNESTYNVLAKNKAGEAVKVEGTITPGTYSVIYKDAQGKLKTSRVGTFEAPKKKSK